MSRPDTGAFTIFSAYSVAVKVSLVNGVSAGLMGMSRAFAKVGGDARMLQRDIDKIKLSMIGGGLMAGTGFLGLGLISKTLPYAKEYTHQLAMMNTAGMKQVEIAQSINAAWALNKSVPTSTATQNLEAIRSLRATLGSTAEAVNFLPYSQKLTYILANSKGMKGSGDVQGEASAFARAMDIRNATNDPARLKMESELMLKAIVGSGGQLSARDFNTVLRLARGAGKGWDADFVYKVLPSLMQELKTGSGNGSGGGPAAGLVSAQQAIVNGKLTNVALAEFMRLGLVDMSKVVRTSTGNVKGIDKGGIVGSELFQSDPYQWAQTILKPAMYRAGVDTQKEMRTSLGQLFRVRTAEGVMASLLLEERQIERDRRMFGIAQGFGAYDTLMKNDPAAADAAMAAQWKNLLTVIGLEILPFVVRGTLKLMDALRDTAKFMREHPLVTKGLIGSFVALSGVLAISGTVWMLVGALAAFKLALGYLSGAAGLGAATTGLRGLAGAAAMGPGIGSGLGAIAMRLGPLGLAIAGILGVLGVAAVAINNGEAAYNAVMANPGGATDDQVRSAASYARMFPRGAGGGSDKVLAEAAKRGAAPTNGGNRASLGRGSAGGGVSPYVVGRPGVGGAGSRGDVYLDGKKVTDALAPHIAKGIGGPNRASLGRHNVAATPPPTALGYKR